MSTNSDTVDKQNVIKFFQSKGIEARPLPELEDSKTPDFELYVAGKLWGYCELKSIFEADWSSGLRHDPTYNTIQSKLHASCKQLASMNPKQEVPNIIFIINHHPYRDYIDLHTVLTGEFLPGNPEVADCRYLKRLINAGDMPVIDYIIWKNLDKDIICFTVNGDSPHKDILKEKISRKAYEKY